MTELLDEIWEGDLLERKEEAQLFINYIKSVSQRPNVREDVSSFTISVDAGYGEGKTYFLKRVAEQMKLNHPVAFVDAWRDDLADEPLTALVVTLQDALGDLIESDSTIKSKFQNVKEKAGAVAKIAGKGLLKKGVSLLITKTAVEAAEDVIGDVTEDTKKEVSKTFDGITDSIVSTDALNTPSSYMQERIDDFKAGRNAIEELKASLKALVDSLDSLDAHEMHAPIVIFIDELDRCRPTYAVKLLEEIKHLFDVEGLVFVFGIHTGQLAHSIAGAYGANFDGKAYLSRFINREYNLKPPERNKFVNYIMERHSIVEKRLVFPKMLMENGDTLNTVSEELSCYFDYYNISNRDIIENMDKISLCLSLTGEIGLYMPLLLPLMLSYDSVISGKTDKYSEGSLDVKLSLEFYDYSMNDSLKKVCGIGEAASNYYRVSKLPSNKLNQSTGKDIYHQIIAQISDLGDQLSKPGNYEKLLNTVGRYSRLNP